MDQILTYPAAETGAAAERRSLLLLRWMLILASAGLFLSTRFDDRGALIDAGMLALFAASNIALYFLWDRLEARGGFETIVAMVDTLFVCLVILVAGVAPAELFVLCFLVVFLVSFGRTMTQIIASAAAVGFLYVWMTATFRPEGMLLHPVFLIRIPFLYSVALYFGYLASFASTERREARAVIRERRDHRLLMDILDTVNSTLDLHRVMLAISTRIAEAVGAERCSVLLVDREDSGLVLASSDKPDVDRLEIDLSRYPEVRQAIERREPVIVEDVQNHPLMKEVRHFLHGAGFNSILVVPMIHRDDLVGTLMLRAASKGPGFDPSTVAFCRTVAGASANALKNAMLYRQVKEESARHRGTIEKLQNILEHSMDLIVTTDLEGRITDFNRTAEETLGYRREELVGQPLTEIYSDAGDRPQFLSLLRSKGEIHEREATMRARDGSGRRLDLTVAVIRNDLNEVVGSVCVGKKASVAN